MSRYPVYRDASGMWCRHGIVSDAYVISERVCYEALGVVAGDVLLDIGANIGSVACQALDFGAACVVAVEPYPANVEILRLNLRRYDEARYEVVTAAVVGNTHEQDTVILHVPDENFGMCSLVKHDVPYAPLTSSLSVPAVSLDLLLERYRPTVLKIDIEAGEYALGRSLITLPAAVRSVAVEWHNFEPHLLEGSAYRNYQRGHKALLSNGYSVVHTSGVLIPQEHSAVLHIYTRCTPSARLSAHPERVD